MSLVTPPDSFSANPAIDPATLEQACQLLRQFDGLKGTLTSVERVSLRRALGYVAEASDYQILGICADTFSQGMEALASYAAALNYCPNLDLPVVEAAVYIKFNPVSQRCYANPYSGNHRGVLVSCQSADASDLTEMFGHLPLDLFAEAGFWEAQASEGKS